MKRMTSRIMPGSALVFTRLFANGAPAVDFTVESIDEIGISSRSTALKVDADFGIHIAYTSCSDDACEDGELRYASRPLPGDDWTIERVDVRRDVGWLIGMELDALGYAHVAYCDHDRRLLKYATFFGIARKKSLYSTYYHVKLY